MAAVVGFGAACRAALRDREARHARWAALSGQIEAGIRGLGGRIVGSGPRVVSHVCGVFAGVPGETIVQGLDLHGVAVSAGAACASGSIEPSPVLVAMGDPEPSGGVRFSLGPTTSAADVQGVLDVLPRVLALAGGGL